MPRAPRASQLLKPTKATPDLDARRKARGKARGTHPKALLKTTRFQIVKIERDRKIFNLRKAGWTYPEIAAAVGCCERAAFEAVCRVILLVQESTKEDVPKVREIEIARLDAMLQSVWDEIEPREGQDIQIVDGNGITVPLPVDRRLATIDRVLKIMERRAKLLGLDTAVKVEHDLASGIREYVGVPVEEV